jgi:hypothetical protein
LIISNGFQFRFDKTYFNQENSWQNEWGPIDINLIVKKPWQIIPIWTNDSEIEKEILEVTKNFKVNFAIYFNNDDQFQICKKYLIDDEKDAWYYLFLKSKNAYIKTFHNKKMQYEIKREVIDNLNNIIQLSGKSQADLFFVKTYKIPFSSMSKEKINKITRNTTIISRDLD